MEKVIIIIDYMINSTYVNLLSVIFIHKIQIHIVTTFTEKST